LEKRIDAYRAGEPLAGPLTGGPRPVSLNVHLVSFVCLAQSQRLLTKRNLSTKVASDKTAQGASAYDAGS
jgi:hypothetical protein